MLDDSCLLTVDGHEAITINAGDSILLPTTPGFTLSSFVPAPPVYMDPNKVASIHSELRYGEQEGPPDMRSATAEEASPGLLRGLGDERLARALKKMHARIDHSWTVEQLAKISALSRSAFFERFTRNELTVSQIAERVGYGSTSAFSVAFGRHLGQPPSQYARSNDGL